MYRYLKVLVMALTRRCPHCGATIPASASKCLGCGR